jgi:hypothetical protein
MTQDSPRLERFLEQAARAFSGVGLHPIRILQQAQEAAQTGVRDGAMPNRYRILVAPAERERLRRLERTLRQGIERMLDEQMAQQQLSRLAEWDIDFDGLPSLSTGEVRVVASFAETAHRPANAGQISARITEVITRVRGTVLVLPDGGRSRVSHVPFVIGRAQGCDLVVPDLSISRRHAVIRAQANGTLLLSDLESRNGITADSGERVEQLVLSPGTAFQLGDARFAVEAEQ